jgi:uncharacterized protein (TIGR02596 family)
MNPCLRSIPLKPSIQRRSKAFTLIELLVVVAMIALIVAAMAPMVMGSLVSTRLTTAGQSVGGQLSLARQLAVSRSETVEVRFYEYPDPETPGAKSSYRAMAIMSRRARPVAVENGLREQLTDTLYLPAGIVIGDSQRLSPLLASGTIQSEQDLERVIKRSNNARYKAFLINPDGSTNLPLMMQGRYSPQECYLTVAEERVLDDDSGEIPTNFFTVQIDPATGRISTYRP